MNAVKKQVQELVKVELEAANKKFSQFRSRHEGWAVILEEVNELSDEYALIEKVVLELWEHIKGDSTNRTIQYDVEWVRKYAINAACEAIQVAAMCKKFLEMEGKR